MTTLSNSWPPCADTYPQVFGNPIQGHHRLASQSRRDSHLYPVGFSSSLQAANSAVDTPSTFVRLAARFDGIHRRNLTETATLLIYGQDQEVRLSVWKQEG